ncbi:MAG: hypothetical protein ABIE03_04050 [Patescibacteria group bacterium]|nr:hypothetical protein [Patescibacteria group bacterium]
MKKNSKSKTIKNETIIQLVILLLVFLSIIVFQHTKAGFMAGHHAWLSTHGLTLASNISPKYNFLMFSAKNYSTENIQYEPYNRFPIFPFLMIKGVTAPLYGDFSGQVYIARQTMNLFLIGAITLAFLTIRRILKNNYQAISVVLIAFSSSYMLYYSDMIFNDTPSLFGFMLAIFICYHWEEKIIKNKALLAVLVLLSILSGWQPYTVYASWFVIKAVAEKRKLGMLKRIVVTFKDPLFLSFLASVIFGGVILTLQILNEWRFLGGNLSDLPTINSIAFRVGLGDGGPNLIEFVIDNQTTYIQNIIKPFLGRVFIPLLALLSPFLISKILEFDYKKYLKKLKLDYRYLVLFIGSGLLWHFMMRNFVFIHDFQAIYLVGIPIVLYLSLSLLIPQNLQKYAAIIIAAVFILSIYQINKEKADSSTSGAVITKEFENIDKQLPEGSKIYIDGDKYVMGGAQHAFDYYLAGNYFTTKDLADYIISEGTQDNSVQLTYNEKINLFKVSD